MPRRKDQAICLRHIDWSETSQIVAMLTRGHGKFRGVAKGSKRLSPGNIARFSGGIELFGGGEVVAMIRLSGELANIYEWDLQRPRYHLRTSLAAQRLAFYGIDLADAMLADLDPHPVTFDALEAFLEALTDPAGGPEALLRFQWMLICDTGYRPRLDSDVYTGEALDEQPLWFDALAGGLTRLEHPPPRGEQDRPPSPTPQTPQGGPSGPASTSRWRIRPATAALLHQLAAETDRLTDSQPPSTTPACRTPLAATPDTITRANRLLGAYIRSLLGRELPTATFLT